jgi:NMD protein affecting ribosome stability and mRNA decay
MRAIFCDRCGKLIKEEESLPDLCEKCYREEMESEYKNKSKKS